MRAPAPLVDWKSQRPSHSEKIAALLEAAELLGVSMSPSRAARIVAAQERAEARRAEADELLPAPYADQTGDDAVHVLELVDHAVALAADRGAPLTWREANTLVLNTVADVGIAAAARFIPQAIRERAQAA